MIPISIDISDTVDEFTLSESEVKYLSGYLLDKISTEFVMRWEEQIDNNLKSTRSEYKKGIFQEQGDDNSVVIGLTSRQSTLALMIEDGSEPFDEKQGFSQSDKRKTNKKDQWYITIPFRFATSGAIGESSAFSGKLPQPIMNLVKSQTTPLTIGDINKVPGNYGELGKNMTSGYQHKFNIYEGLQRVEVGSGQNESRGAYMNFRRVSENSDPAAWIHPGFEARHFMEAAIEDTDISSIVDHAVDEFLNLR